MRPNGWRRQRIVRTTHWSGPSPRSSTPTPSAGSARSRASASPPRVEPRTPSSRPPIRRAGKLPKPSARPNRSPRSSRSPTSRSIVAGSAIRSSFRSSTRPSAASTRSASRPRRPSKRLAHDSIGSSRRPVRPRSAPPGRSDSPSCAPRRRSGSAGSRRCSAGSTTPSSELVRPRDGPAMRWPEWPGRSSRRRPPRRRPRPHRADGCADRAEGTRA